MKRVNEAIFSKDKLTYFDPFEVEARCFTSPRRCTNSYKVMIEKLKKSYALIRSEMEIGERWRCFDETSIGLDKYTYNVYKSQEIVLMSRYGITSKRRRFRINRRGDIKIEKIKGDRLNLSVVGRRYQPLVNSLLEELFDIQVGPPKKPVIFFRELMEMYDLDFIKENISINPDWYNGFEDYLKNL